MAQFAKRFRLDLANSLAGDVEEPSDFFERSAVTVGKTEAEIDNLPLAVGQGVEDLAQTFLQEVTFGNLERILARQVGNEVAVVGVVVVSDLRLQRYRLLGHALDRPHLIDGHFHFLGQLLFVRLAAELLDEPFLDAHELVDRFDHMHRNADRAGLVGDRARGGLADPPGGTGRKLVSALVLELLDRLHEAGIAFLDEVEERKSAVHVLLHDGDDESEVRLHHLGPGRLSGLEHLAQFREGGDELLGRHPEERLHPRHALPHGF